MDIALLSDKKKPIFIASVFRNESSSLMSHLDILRTAALSSGKGALIFGLVTDLKYWWFTSYLNPKNEEILTTNHIKMSQRFVFGTSEKVHLKSILCLLRGFILQRSEYLQSM